MGIESISSQAAINIAVNQQNTSSAVTSRPVTKADADNNVRVESTDGKNTQAQEPSSANANSNANVNASVGASANANSNVNPDSNANVNVSINGYTNKDTRTPEEKKAAENERIQKAIERMNAQLPNSEIKFGIHEKTDRVMIKLLDKETKEVIKEFPPEKTLDMIAKCMEIAGVILDEKL